jgi:hypothetical protein
MLSHLRATLLAAMIGCFIGDAGRVAAQSEAAAVQGILRVIPPDAHAALIVPNLKRASDDLTRLLEGMDRANLLLGLRPIDQFKSVTGFTVGLDDHGSAAIVVLDTGDPLNNRPAQTVTIVPVRDPQEFIKWNLPEMEEGEPDARRRTDGTIVYVKPLAAHIIMGEDMQAVRSYSERDGLEPTLAAMAGKHTAIFTHGEFGIIARQPAIAALKQSLLQHAHRAGAALPGVAMLSQHLADDVDLVALSLDCDPLAVIVRGFARFDDNSDFGTFVPSDTQAPAMPAPASLSALPNKPYAFAISVNLTALGGENMVQAVTRVIGQPPNDLPRWMAGTSAFTFAIALSQAGAAGGLLNEATLTLAADDPAVMRDAIRHDMLALQNNDRIKREVEWKENQPLANTAEGLSADAWEARTMNVPPEFAHVEIAERLLFGASGMRGYVRQESGTVLMTFSQRPAVMQALSKSVRETADSAASTNAGFGGSATIRTMRRWLPAQRDIEMYMHPGPARQMLTMLWPTPLPLPEFGMGLPPVGAALDVQPRQASATAIVPTGILAPLFDELTRRVPLPQPQPSHQSQPRSPGDQ